jgi:hypothetical protein
MCVPIALRLGDQLGNQNTRRRNTQGQIIRARVIYCRRGSAALQKQSKNLNNIHEVRSRA